MPLLFACTVAATAAVDAEEAKPDPFVCAATPKAVVSLDHGSRYVAADKSRSEFDEAENKADDERRQHEAEEKTQEKT